LFRWQIVTGILTESISFFRLPKPRNYLIIGAPDEKADFFYQSLRLVAAFGALLLVESIGSAAPHQAAGPGHGPGFP
jgi:hypothetical protein